ncbi:B-cell lymphoma/leukemia 10 [Crotalus adamanteus]|uniref:B-cell lymphoma/leukemia 10 n=1 Tax=Crotalus adamanteus TaxID=8729 RepID=A0AAW1BQQ0_CROAD
MADAELTAAGRSLTEDEMAEVKKEVLERLRRYLCDKIIAERHFDYLRSKKILSRDDTEEISCRTSKKITDAVLKAKNEKLESLKGTRCNNCMASMCDEANNLSRSQSNDSNFFEKQRDRENTYLPPEEYSTAAFVSASSLRSMNLPITESMNFLV